jgi:hypothetical protein
MSIQKCSFLLLVGFMGIASGMQDSCPETTSALSLLFKTHEICNNDTIGPKIQLKKEMNDYALEMKEFAQNNSTSPTFHQDMNTKRNAFASTERGAQILLESQVAQLQMRNAAKNPLLAGKTLDEIYTISALLNLDQKPVLDQIAQAFGIQEYANKKNLTSQIQNAFAEL